VTSFETSSHEIDALIALAATPHRSRNS
jgi:hypothetical protein